MNTGLYGPCVVPLKEILLKKYYKCKRLSIKNRFVALEGVYVFATDVLNTWGQLRNCVAVP